MREAADQAGAQNLPRLQKAERASAVSSTTQSGKPIPVQGLHYSV
jgi:hypothetical protein